MDCLLWFWDFLLHYVGPNMSNCSGLGPDLVFRGLNEDPKKSNIGILCSDFKISD